MKLNYILLCDNAFVDSEGQLNAIQIFDQINTTNILPVAHPRMTIVTNFTMELDESKSDHNQKVEILDPTGSPIASVNANMHPEMNESKLQLISTFFGTIFKVAGIYTIRTTIDEKEVKNSLEFIVKKLPSTNE